MNHLHTHSDLQASLTSLQSVASVVLLSELLIEPHCMLGNAGIRQT